MPFVELDEVKDDLGLTGNADDEWLQRRIDGVLAAMSGYTHRYIGDVATFEDDFTRIVDSGRLWIAPPYPSLMRVTPRLAMTPVVSIVSATNNGAAITPASNVRFNPKSGEILSLDGGTTTDLARSLIGAVVIRYTAGWPAIPRDLYEILVAIIRNQYVLRRASGSGGLNIGGLGVQSIQVPDVGSVQLGNGATAFETAAGKGAVDPILGPYAKSLDPYFVPVIADVGRPQTTRIETP